MRSARPLFVGALFALCSQAQVFDVASVKLSAPGSGSGGSINSTDRTLNVTHATLRGCIANAYDVQWADVDGPSWLDSERIDIVAKATDGSHSEDLPKMFQALLVERFKLKTHIETKETAGYALRAAKGGLKLEDIGTKPRPGRVMQGSVTSGRLIGANGIRMETLARALAEGYGAPVVDETGTSNYFLVNLEFSPVDIDVESGGGLKPSLMTALREQAGLQLEKARVRVDHVIVESVERKPTEN